MFIILIKYSKSLETVDRHVVAHCEFLDECYQKHYFIASGPLNPRTGGVIISQLNERKQIEEIIQQDPFHIHNMADYEIIEFIPTKYHQNFSSFIKI